MTLRLRGPGTGVKLLTMSSHHEFTRCGTFSERHVVMGWTCVFRVSNHDTNRINVHSFTSETLKFIVQVLGFPSSVLTLTLDHVPMVLVTAYGSLRPTYSKPPFFVSVSSRSLNGFVHMCVYKLSNCCPSIFYKKSIYE